MTDRVRTLTVVLDEDYRDDDVGTIVSALSMVKGVGSVHLVPLEPMEVMSRQVAKNELRREVLGVIMKLLAPGP